MRNVGISFEKVTVRDLYFYDDFYESKAGKILQKERFLPYLGARTRKLFWSSERHVTVR